MVTLEILYGVSNQTPPDREVILPSQIPGVKGHLKSLNVGGEAPMLINFLRPK